MVLDEIKERLADRGDDLADYRRVLLPTTREDIIVTAGNGSTIDLVMEGDRYTGVVDATSQVGTTPLGHRYGPLLDDLRELYREDSDFPLMIDGQGYFHPYQRELGEKLTEIYPGDLSTGDLKTYYCNSGSEAVERGALKAAQLYSGGTSFMTFNGAFHGRTSLALSHTNSKGTYTEGIHFLARTLVAPYATESGGELHNDPVENAERCVRAIEEKIRREGPDNLNSIMIEPLQGEGGYNVPHPRFMKGLRELCTEHDIPLIADEVQAAFRTGEWFGIENAGVQPDMISVSKTFSGGVAPFGAAMIKDRFATDQQSKHSGTFGGNAKECFIALRTIELIEDNDLLEHARDEGTYLAGRLQDLAQDHEVVYESRGKGLFRGVEFREDGDPAPDLRDRVLHHMLEEGNVLTEPCGNDRYNTAIRFLPPLNIPHRHVESMADAIEDAVREVAR